MPALSSPEEPTLTQQQLMQKIKDEERWLQIAREDLEYWVDQYTQRFGPYGQEGRCIKNIPVLTEPDGENAGDQIVVSPEARSRLGDTVPITNATCPPPP